MKIKRFISAALTTAMLTTLAVPSMTALAEETELSNNAVISSELTFYDAEGDIPAASCVASIKGSSTIVDPELAGAARYFVATYSDYECSKLTGVKFADYTGDGGVYSAITDSLSVDGKQYVAEYFLNKDTFQPLQESKKKIVNPVATPVPTQTPSSIIVEAENYNSKTGTFYLVNGSGWFGTVDFSNNEAININSGASTTYNLTTATAGAYELKLYGGNIKSGEQAGVIVSVNGVRYTANAPAINGIGDYNYENVIVSEALALTGNDTIIITCNSSNWAGIDYLEFTPTTKPVVTPTPAPLTGDVWTVNVVWKNTNPIPEWVHADIYNNVIRNEAKTSAVWIPYNVVHPITSSTTSFEVVTITGQDWSMTGDYLKYENDDGTILSSKCENWDTATKTITLTLEANESYSTPTPVPTPAPSADCVKVVPVNGISFDYGIEYNEGVGGAADTLKVPATKGADLTFESEKDSAFTMKLKAKAESTNSKAKIIVNDNEFDVTLESSVEEYTEITVDDLLLNGGMNSMRIEAVDDGMTIEYISFTSIIPQKGAGEQVSIQVEAENYGPKGTTGGIPDVPQGTFPGRNVWYFDTTDGIDDESYYDKTRPDDVEVSNYEPIAVTCQETEWMTYEFDVPKSGYYLIYVTQASDKSGKCTFTFSDDTSVDMALTQEGTAWQEYTTNVSDEPVFLSKGTVKVRFTAAQSARVYDYFRFVKVELEAIPNYAFAGDEALILNRTIPRGTDNFRVYFNDTIASLDGAKVEVVDDDGNSIPLSVDFDMNELSVLLNRTLDYNKQYHLMVSGVSTTNAKMAATKTYDFMTSNAAADDGSATSTIESLEIEDGVITVQGNVNSSKAAPIANRIVTLTVYDPDGQQFGQAVNVLSKSNGTYSASATLSDTATKSGKYGITVSTEYEEGYNSASVVYLTKELEKKALEELADTESIDEVKKWLDDYSEYFGVDYNSDIAGLGDKTLFYRHFVGVKLDNYKAFNNIYSKYLNFEKINQGSSSEIDAILKDEEKCQSIGIDGNKSLGIVNNRAAYLNELAGLGDMETPEAYADKYDDVTNTYLAEEYSKSDVEQMAIDKSCNPGQGVTLSLGFTTAQTDLSKATFEIETDNTTILNSMKLSSVDGEGTLNIVGNTAYITITPTSASAKKLGELKFTAPNATGTYKLDFAGDVEYAIVKSTNIYPIYTSIKDDVVSIKVNTAPSGGGGGGGSSGSSGSSSGKAITPSVVPVETFEFTDLDNYEWAKESINYLLEKEVISKSDDAKFYPERNITREEFVKMVVIAVGAEDAQATTDLKDVKQGDWFYPYVASAQKMGIVKGDDFGNFGVGQNITRQDMATMIARAMEKQGFTISEDGDKFADDDAIASYAKAPVYTMRRLGIMNGVGDNMCAPRNNATRAMAAKMIYGLMKAVGR